MIPRSTNQSSGTRLTLPRQRAQETRQRILDSGTAAFSQNGYGQTTVEQIASKAGISIGAFYHHFPGKDDLLKAILEGHISGAMIDLHELFPASSLREMIERFVNAWFHHIESTLDFNRIFRELSNLAVQEAWITDAVSGFYREGAEAIAEVLRLAQRFGLVRADLDPVAASAVIEAMMEGLEALWAGNRDIVDSAPFKSAWADALDRFLAADAPGDFEGFQAEAGRLFAPNATD